MNSRKGKSEKRLDCKIYFMLANEREYLRARIFPELNNINETGNETWGDERQGRPSSSLLFFFIFWRYTVGT